MAGIEAAMVDAAHCNANLYVRVQVWRARGVLWKEGAMIDLTDSRRRHAALPERLENRNE
ncbi:hypothetical protein [Caballeronia calidae]|uniref:hypothetical protein n=1 Tax=Caballeronia calidae TaxID=1777139 RepID=UPI000BB43634|nr:hypothetical protein [Caballeronia calidae]